VSQAEGDIKYQEGYNRAHADQKDEFQTLLLASLVKCIEFRALFRLFIEAIFQGKATN
jgi:hypothetical protein